MKKTTKTKAKRPRRQPIRDDDVMAFARLLPEYLRTDALLRGLIITAADVAINGPTVQSRMGAVAALKSLLDPDSKEWMANV